MDEKELYRIVKASTKLYKRKNDKKNIVVHYIISALYLILFVLMILMQIFVFDIDGRNLNDVILNGASLALSIILTTAYCLTFKAKSYQIIGLYISVCIECFGCFALSKSTELYEALLANKIAYLGYSFIPLALLAITLKVCNIKHNKKILYVLSAVSIAAAILPLTAGYSDAFYKSVDFVNDGGIATLSAEYGPAYIVYQVYVGVYYALAAACLIYTVTKYRVSSKVMIEAITQIIFVNVIVMINTIIDYSENYLTSMMSIISLFYMTTILLEMPPNAKTVLINRKNYNANKSITFPDYFEWELSRKTHDKNPTISDEFGDYKIPSDFDKQIDEGIKKYESEHILKEESEYVSEIDFSKYSDEQSREFLSYLDGWKSLSKTEKTIAVYLLKDIKRADIAAALDRMEDTIKTHTSHIYKKLGIKNREELCSAVIKKMRERKII